MSEPPPHYESAGIESATLMGSLDAVTWMTLVLVLLAAGTATAGCCLLLFAGRLERLGRLEPARSHVRRGGLLLPSGSALHIVALIVWWLAERPEADAVWAVTTAGLFGLAGFVGLLAGLSGKPRPSGWFAVGFYVAACLALCAAVGIR